MEHVDFLVVGCGPAGGTAAREAARAGISTLVLERDPIVGAKRVCAAGLRPGFCEDFNLPRSIVHCNPTTIVMQTAARTYAIPVGVAHTTTREELDGTIGRLAQAEGAEIRTSALFRGVTPDGDETIVEYADTASGERKRVRARGVFLAQGSSARVGSSSPFAYPNWSAGLITCFQYRIYPERPAIAAAYDVLELAYYVSPWGRSVIGWMFPKRDHLAIGLGIGGKVGGKELRAELDWFVPQVQARLFPGIGYTVREEGNLLYGGKPRPTIGTANVMIGGTAAGLVDATTGEGIHEAAVSGRSAAAAMTALHRGQTRSAGLRYEREIKHAFYGRLYHRHKLMHFLERKVKRFDLLFDQLERTPRLAALLQRDRNDFSVVEWLYLFLQAGRFGLRSLRA